MQSNVGKCRKEWSSWSSGKWFIFKYFIWKYILYVMKMCYDFSSVSFTHVFLTSDSRFTSSSFYHFDQLCSMFHNHAFHFHMFTICISMHAFHTCYIHVYFLLIYYMPCKHGLLVYKLVCRLSCFLS